MRGLENWWSKCYYARNPEAQALGSRMAVDPLSSATRTAKRNLLIAASLAITYRTFDIAVDKIPVAGISINFDSGVFAFLLTMALLYYTLTFALYYYVDIRNFETTHHQTTVETTYKKALDTFAIDYLQHTITLVEREIDSSQRLQSLIDGDALRNFTRPFLDRRLPDKALKITVRSSTEPRNPNSIPDEHLPDHLQQIVDRRMKHFWWRYWLHRIWYERLRWGVRLTYSVRNYIVDGVLPIALAILRSSLSHHRPSLATCSRTRELTTWTLSRAWGSCDARRRTIRRTLLRFRRHFGIRAACGPVA